MQNIFFATKTFYIILRTQINFKLISLKRYVKQELAKRIIFLLCNEEVFISLYKL